MDNLIKQITQLRLSNYRTFSSVSIPLSPLTIIIGPNGSGKSNLISAIRFIRDIAKHGLDDAVSMQGGIDSLRNLYTNKQTPIRVGFDLRAPGMTRSMQTLVRPKPKPRVMPRLQFRNVSISYDLSLVATRSVRRFKIESESLTVRFEGMELYYRTTRNLSPVASSDWSSITVKFTNSGTAISTTHRVSGATEVRFSPSLIEKDLLQLDEQESLLHQRQIGVWFEPIVALSHIVSYDIDPRLGKTAVPVTGRAELEEDGDNLPSALRAILSNSGRKRRLVDLVGDVLPFVKGIDVASFADMTRFLQVKERYAPKSNIPAYLLSDGTIDVIALIVALYFQENITTIFEEPDRSLHPALIRRIASMMVEQAEHRQLLISTHSQELINAVPAECVLCVSRNDSGFSSLFHPSDAERFAKFIQAMGLGRLYADGLLAPK